MDIYIYIYMQNSNKKVDWKCPDCDNIISERSIGSIKQNGISCHNCSDGFSYPEKFMFGLLRQLNIDFFTQKCFERMDSKRYDFYIPSLNIIIETHGEQHYKQTTRKRARTLEEEQSNDRYKYELAIVNGIKPENYIVIDCRYSDFEFIKNNILNSRLAELFDLSEVDWDEVEKHSQNKLIFCISQLWNNEHSTDEILKLLKIGRTSLLRYLKKGTELGLCEYSKDESFRRRVIVYKKTKIVQLDSNYGMIKRWDSMSDAMRGLKLKSAGGISRCCKGEISKSNGYIWMYKEDYEKYIKEQNEIA